MSLRNVIYYDSTANSIPLAEIANLPYTDIIIGFLYPDPNFNLYADGGAFDDQIKNNIRTLQDAGKNVLVSFGGQNSSFLSSAYKYYAQNAQNLETLVDQIVGGVNAFSFNGVDIDFEDSDGFTGKAGYDGVQFLVDLTSMLYQKLPPGRNIITHAPQTPYWYPDGGFGAAYQRIWQQVGNQIAWFNNQFYSNSQYDAYAELKVQTYQQIAAINGGPPPQKLLLGAIFVATDDNGNPIDGYLPLDQLTSDVITPLKAKFGSEFGGVMGWEFSYDQGGAWANGIGQALGDLFVFYQGAGNSGGLWYTDSSDSINWTQHTPVPNLQMKELPSAVLWQDGIAVFHQAGNGQLWRTFSSDGNSWGTTHTDAQVQGVGMSGSPSAVVYKGSLYVFYQGLNNSGGLWYTVSSDSINWTQHTPVPNLQMKESPSAVLWQGGIQVFHQAGNGQLWRTFSSDGNSWGTTQTDAQVPGVGMSGSPSAVVYNGSLYVFYQGVNNSGGLWYAVSSDSIHWTQHNPVPNLQMKGSPSAVLWRGGIEVFHQAGNGQLWRTFSSDGNSWGTTQTDALVQGVGMSASPSCVVF